ncbi:MAG: hypothetical protein IT289_02710 [Oligoflexia bacterium]|nr:hypothetical protein [Oligoflexia bacterium]
MFKSALVHSVLYFNKAIDLPGINLLTPPQQPRILLLYGDEDLLTPSFQSELLKEVWPPFETVVFKGAKHSKLINHAPHKLESVVLDFLEK